MERKITVSEFKQKLIEESEKKKILLSATIEITSACCFKCPHCYIDNNNIGFISPNSFKRIITELKSLGCIYLTLTGGEALMHPHFNELYLMACEAGFIISLFSNGYFLDQKIGLLSDNKPYEVDITLYGIDNESYLQNTGIADGERVFNNLTLLKNNNIVFSLKAAVTKNVLPYINDMYNLSRKFGVTFRSDYYIFLSAQHSNVVGRLSPTEIVESLCSNEEYIELEKKALINSNKDEWNLLYRCHPGETNIYITWNELVKMCPFTSNQHSFQINASGKTIQMARDYLQELGSQIIDKNHKCFNCEYATTCRRCPERFFVEEGDYYTPPCWMCEAAEKTYEVIKK